MGVLRQRSAWPSIRIHISISVTVTNMLVSAARPPTSRSHVNFGPPWPWRCSKLFKRVIASSCATAHWPLTVLPGGLVPPYRWG